MPFLDHRLWPGSPSRGSKPPAGEPSPALFPECSNPSCASGRIHLWRSRRIPAIEGGWVCSPECTLRRVQVIISRELRGHSRAAEMHSHRVPLGLILLAQGWISREQLRSAIQAKRNGYPGRIGAWLMEHCKLEEQRVTEALSLQWNCPVLAGEPDRGLLALPPIPRILIDTFALVPLRLSGSGSLFLAFEDRIDHSLTLAIERIIGQRVEAGLLSGSEFQRAHRRMLAARFPRARLIEGGGAEALAAALAQVIEKAQPADAWIVRVRHLLWLRLWSVRRQALAGFDPSDQCKFEDVVCSLPDFE
jgi:hypothetical protein